MFCAFSGREHNKLKKYSVIIADPPWEYSSSKAIVGNGGRGGDASHIVQVGVDHHYNTLSLDKIKSMRVDDLAERDCLLFLWVTNSFLVNGAGTEVVRSWGFIPKSLITWAKVKEDGITPSMKSGHWFRGASEHAIFAVRGKPKRPDDWPALATWFSTMRKEHSRKPTKLHRYAEQYDPTGNKLELFSRRARRGWDHWGNEYSTIEWQPWSAK